MVFWHKTQRRNVSFAKYSPVYYTHAHMDTPEHEIGIITFFEIVFVEEKINTLLKTTGKKIREQYA